MADLIIPKIWEGKEICICVTDERAVFVYDKEQNKFIDTGETAIELPPHGRCIDADHLQEVLRLVLSFVISNELTEKEISLVHRTICAISEAINDLDTVLEANNG